MQVDQIIETPAGTVQFKGELNPLETEAVVRAGLNWLLQQGILPVTQTEDTQQQ